MAPARRLLWPQNLVGRVGFVLFVAVLLEVIGGSLVLEQADLAWTDDAQAQRIAEQLDAASRVLSVTAGPQRPLVARTLSGPGLVLEWHGTKTEAEPEPAGTAKTNAFRAQVLEDEPALLDRHLAVHADLGDALAGDLRLDDGSVLGFRAAPPRSGSRLPMRLVALVALSGCVLLAALLVVRTLAAPLRSLAEATDAIGHGPSVQMVEGGPSDVRRVARAFNAMQQRIGKLLRDRTEALAAVSHDLRTPISRMRLRTSFLDQAEDRDAFETDLVEMEAMLTALLAYLGGENDPEKPRKSDVAALLATLVDDAVDAGHAASYEGPDHCVLDIRPLGLKRAFSNIVNNAIAYGGNARIKLADTVAEVTVTIDDDGAGIADTDLGSVFEPFYRADAARNHAKGGMGLGLAIALQAITRERGSIALANRPEGGLRALITLPR